MHGSGGICVGKRARVNFPFRTRTENAFSAKSCLDSSFEREEQKEREEDVSCETISPVLTRRSGLDVEILSPSRCLGLVNGGNVTVAVAVDTRLIENR